MKKQSQNSRSPHPVRKSSRKERSPSRKKEKDKKSLNSYQRFVKHESQKEKYSGMPTKERMMVIAKEWRRKNKS